MDLEHVDQVCDRFEARLKNGERVTVGRFIAEEKLPYDAELIDFLIPVQQEYDTPNEADDVTLESGDGDSRGKVSYNGRRIGEYQILDKLGEGGMGVVYKARHMKLGRLVAIKMILAGEHASDNMLARFRAEAEAAARLNHPNIVALYEVGKHDGFPYFASEFVDGQTLSHLIRSLTLNPQRAAELAQSLALATHYSHQQGIVHRDLKPQNVLITKDGKPKIADFGLAKRLDASAPDHTASGAILGTPGFMSPEQATADRDIGPPADIYALGAVLYAMLTGSAPFKAPTPLETIRLVAKEEPVSPSRLQPGLNRDLETICLKCLRKEPDRRYETAADLADDLKRFIEGRPIVARPTSRRQRLWMWCKREPVYAILIALASILGLSLLIGGWATAAVVSEKNEEITAQNEKISSQYEQIERESDYKLSTYRDLIYGIDGFFQDNYELRPLQKELFSVIESRIESTTDNGGEVLPISLARHQGEMYAVAGAHNKALEKLLEAEQMAIELHAADELPDPYFNFATLDKWIGQSSLQENDRVEAEKRFKSLIENRKKHFAENPQVSELQVKWQMSEAWGLLAQFYMVAGRLDEAKPVLDQCVEARRFCYEQAPESLNRLEQYAGALGTLASYHSRLGQFDDMQTARMHQIQLLGEAVEKKEDSLRLSNLFMARAKLGKEWLLDGDESEAISVLEDGVATFEKRRQKGHFIPATVQFHGAAANTWLGIALDRTGADSSSAYERSIEIYDELIAMTDSDYHKKAKLLVLARAGRKDEASKAAEPLAAAAGIDPAYAALAYGMLSQRTGTPAEREKLAEQCIDIVRRLIRGGIITDFKTLRGETDLEFAELVKVEGYREMLDAEEARLSSEDK